MVGHEEAAAQGLIAGLSAALGEPFALTRLPTSVSYRRSGHQRRRWGAYRMFSSRAEHRLLLRRTMPIVVMPHSTTL